MSSPLVFSGLGLTDPTFIPNPTLSINSEFRFPHEDDSSDTSSIGVDDDDNSSSSHEDEAESKPKDAGALASLDSIEESLPIKRGLSNFFSGKSKSFASLAEMGGGMSTSSSAADLAKAENPFNKRRRILMASKARRASYSSLITTYLPPLLSPDNTVLEEGDEEEEEKDECSTTDSDSIPLKNDRVMAMKKAFRSPRSFSLSDLRRAEID